MTKKSKANCPTPHKTSFYSEESAIGAAIRVSSAIGAARVYLCPCGARHITNEAKRRSRV